MVQVAFLSSGPVKDRRRPTRSHPFSGTALTSSATRVPSVEVNTACLGRRGRAETRARKLFRHAQRSGPTTDVKCRPRTSPRSRSAWMSTGRSRPCRTYSGPVPASGAARRLRRPPCQPLEPCRRLGDQDLSRGAETPRAPSPAPSFVRIRSGARSVDGQPTWKVWFTGMLAPGTQSAQTLTFAGSLSEVAPALPPNWTIHPSSDPSSGHLWPNPCGRGTRTTPGCCRCSRPHRGRAPAPPEMAT